MKFYKQTITHTETTNGNCWATCLACLLDLDSIPELDVMASDWWEQSERLANTKGLTLFEVAWSGGRFLPRDCIVSGDSPRGKFKHSVIGRINANYEKSWVDFIHDVHPDNSFINSVDYITIAIPK